MKKQGRKTCKGKLRNPKRWRKNPAYMRGIASMVESYAGDLMVSAALHGATLPEKVMLASIMPGILAVVREGEKERSEPSAEDDWQ